MPAPQQRQSLVQRQSLTGRLQLSLRLLASTGPALDALLAEEIGRNPLLRWEDDDRPAHSPPGTPGAEAVSPTCGQDDLFQQLRLAMPDKLDQAIGAKLIALLDAAGRVTQSDQGIATLLRVPPARVAAVRARMQLFEPVGLFAETLQDCLAAQLRDQAALNPAMLILLQNLDLVMRREDARLQALCHVTPDELQHMLRRLRGLNPKPGTLLETSRIPPPQLRIPDLLARRVAGRWRADINTAALPRIALHNVAGRRVGTQDQRQAAGSLLRALRRRSDTIRRVGAEIVRQQEAFLDGGVLRPLGLRALAKALDLHESTVSRAIAGKWIDTPRGLLALRALLSTSLCTLDGRDISAGAVRDRVGALISAEKPGKVLSDQAIVSLLRCEGVDISRRTVAKYRDTLRIPGSAQRKRSLHLSVPI